MNLSSNHVFVISVLPVLFTEHSLIDLVIHGWSILTMYLDII